MSLVNAWYSEKQAECCNTLEARTMLGERVRIKFLTNEHNHDIMFSVKLTGGSHGSPNSG